MLPYLFAIKLEDAAESNKKTTLIRMVFGMKE